MLKHSDENMAKSSSPEEGCYLNGFFLEGAAWDDQNGVLRESDPKVIHVPLPVMHFIPRYLLADNAQDDGSMPPSRDEPNSGHNSQSQDYQSLRESFVYECPAYKTSERAG